MNLILPKNVKYIINQLKEHGYNAYAVGGCVRDIVIGREPYDWDITTNAKPNETQSIFKKTIETGIKHGTITVVIENENFEVTTFRIDEEYDDYRRPKSVKFVSNIEEDLARRDFTINAMAYSEESGIIDPYFGIKDLNVGIIRAVGNPEKRFSEDALRMLRAVRFSARFGFKIDEVTFEAMKKCAHLIPNISRERIREEITGILTTDNPEYFKLLYEAGILKYILPEVDECFSTPQNCRWHVYDVGNHTMAALSASENNILVRWSLLLHDIGKVDTRTTDNRGNDHFYGHADVSEKNSFGILTRLKFDNESKEKILKLIRAHDRMIEPREKAVRRALNQYGEELYFLLLKVKYGDLKGKTFINTNSPNDVIVKKNDTRTVSGISLAEGKYTSGKLEIENSKKESRLKKLGSEEQGLEKLKEIAENIIDKRECFSLKNLVISGQDLIDLGVEKGPEIGKILDFALKIVIDDPMLNNKEVLINKIKEKIIKRG